MSHSKKLAYYISKIPIPQNERKQTGPKRLVRLASTCATVECVPEPDKQTIVYL
jgi:hypothetical protein